jgi:hypothetical protein
MRHFLRRKLGNTEPPLSRCVLAGALTRALVGRSGAAYRLPTADRSTRASAVDLAAIARRAYLDLAATAIASKVAEAVFELPRPPWYQKTCLVHASERSCSPEAMAKIGRNEPCPCGSGKKYKRCCLDAPATRGATATTHAPSESDHELCTCCVDELNERADMVLDELLAGRVDEAEALCHKFIRDFPGQAEGIDLLSMIFEERGQSERALELLRQASNIAHANPDYDAETRALMMERIKELELRA